MTENNNILNEEQLKEAAGGKELRPKIDDDVANMLRKLLLEKSLFFSPKHEADYPEIKTLHYQIEHAYTTGSYSDRRQRVYLGLWYTDKFLATLNNFIGDLLDIKESLLKIQEIIGDRD